MPGRDIIVIGASAGGVETLRALVSGLPEDLPAAVFVVVHISPEVQKSFLPNILSRAGPLPARHAVDGEPVQAGRIYVAPPDRHMILRPGHVHLTRGPRENRTRPAVDALFRSAASAYGPRVAGLVLSGMGDDGTMGLLAIERAGGATVAQDPEDALFAPMPQAAVRYASAQHVAPLDRIPALLESLARVEPVEPSAAAAPSAKAAAPLDELAEQRARKEPNRASGLTCPECSGALWEIPEADFPQYECRIGHRFAGERLLTDRTTKAEDSLSISLLSLEERAELADRLAARVRDRGDDAWAATRYAREAEEAHRLAGEVRRLLSDDGLGRHSRD